MVLCIYLCILTEQMIGIFILKGYCTVFRYALKSLEITGIVFF